MHFGLPADDNFMVRLSSTRTNCFLYISLLNNAVIGPLGGHFSKLTVCFRF